VKGYPCYKCGDVANAHGVARCHSRDAVPLSTLMAEMTTLSARRLMDVRRDSVWHSSPAQRNGGNDLATSSQGHQKQLGSVGSKLNFGE
jgi:hypothetical protein